MFSCRVENWLTSWFFSTWVQRWECMAWLFPVLNKKIEPWVLHQPICPEAGWSSRSQCDQRRVALLNDESNEGFLTWRGGTVEAWENRPCIAQEVRIKTSSATVRWPTGIGQRNNFSNIFYLTALGLRWQLGPSLWHMGFSVVVY